MKIGIVGDGVVGSACRFGFEKLGHEVKVHDIKYNTKLKDLLDCEIIYICVPTPQRSDGSCDTSIVANVVYDLCSWGPDGNEYNGVIAIKSTVEPGTTGHLIKQTKNPNICFVPEFLRERCAISDFVEHQDLLAVGTSISEVYDVVRRSHGSYPKQTVVLSPTEAELLKYYSNVMNAMRVIFANEMYEICKKLGADYASVKNAYLLRSKMPDAYLDVNDNWRGYAGVCLPKDTAALAALVKKLGLPLSLFECIEEENAKFRKTVPPGMRQ